MLVAVGDVACLEGEETRERGRQIRRGLCPLLDAEVGDGQIEVGSGGAGQEAHLR